MTLSDLASLASVTSGLAVLVSLVFLYFQMRQLGAQLEQTEKNQRAVLSQGYVDRTTETARWLADSPQAGLMTRAMAGETDFTSEEMWRMAMMFRNIILNAQDTFLQHRANLIDDMSLENTILSLTRSYLCQPVYRALWTGQRDTIAAEFRAEIDAMIAKTEVAKPADMATWIRAEIAKTA